MRGTGLAHDYFYRSFFFIRAIWNDIARYGLSVDEQGTDALFYMIRILNGNRVNGVPVPACQSEITEIGRNTWIDLQAVMGRIESENVL